MKDVWNEFTWLTREFVSKIFSKKLRYFFHFSIVFFSFQSLLCFVYKFKFKFKFDKLMITFFSNHLFLQEEKRKTEETAIHLICFVTILIMYIHTHTQTFTWIFFLWNVCVKKKRKTKMIFIISSSRRVDYKRLLAFSIYYYHPHHHHQYEYDENTTWTMYTIYRKRWT